MSTDLRNSIYLWAGAIAVFGLFLVAARFDVLAGVPRTWIACGLGLLAVINICQFLWGLWQRRASTRNDLKRL